MIIILNPSKAPRCRLKTPKKGTTGDMTNESMASMTDIPSILQRYGGNLAEIAGWNKGNYGDATIIPQNLQEAFEMMRNAHDDFVNLQDNPFGSFEEAYKAFLDGSFESKIVEASKKKVEKTNPEIKVETHETENQ